VHFGNHTSHYIPSEDQNAVHKHFMNTMKQALYLQHSSAEVGMSVAKAVQLKMWESLKANDGVAFASADMPFDDVKRVPVRICIEGRPPIQGNDYRLYTVI
jgi:Autophagy protein Apg5